jgi:adenosine/AMP kinase
MRMPRMAVCIALLASTLLAVNISAQSYNVVIGDIPQIDSLYEVVKAMGPEMKATLNMTKAPMARLTNLIISKQADIGAPMLYLKDPNMIKNLPFDYSTATTSKMCFILYTNKAKPIDIANLKKGNSKKYSIETDVSNMQLFSFTALPSTNIVGSLKKVNSGAIDGYIMGVSPTDDIMKASKGEYGNIKRQLWEIYDMGFAIQKGARGGPVDKFLLDGMAKMHSSGKYKQIMGESPVGLETYDDWQP